MSAAPIKRGRIEPYIPAGAPRGATLVPPLRTVIKMERLQLHGSSRRSWFAQLECRHIQPMRNGVAPTALRCPWCPPVPEVLS